MPNHLNVTLDESTVPPCLHIDPDGSVHHVARGPDVQTITWDLTGNAAAGSFDAQGGPAPGFAWVGSPPKEGIFGDPVLSRNGNRMTISDRNNSTDTTGEWTYRLSATIGGVVYRSNVDIR